MTAKDDLGRYGEALAAEFLAARGLTVLEHNWRCPQGEIDIIATDGDVTVFAEVKTRSGLRYGHPFDAITLLKLTRLRALAAAWCRAHPGNHDRIRIDAIAVVVARGAASTVEHLPGIF
jgi:putative endonuclease